MHETDHRFTVSGYVYDKQGKPVGDARIHVRDLRDQTVEAVTTYTDGTGYYKAVIHLHNGNAGDPVQVTAIEEKLGLEEEKTVRAGFSPDDVKTERQVTVHIGPVPEHLPEAAGYSRSIIVGSVVAGAVGAMLWWRQRKTRNAGKRRGKKRKA